MFELLNMFQLSDSSLSYCRHHRKEEKSCSHCSESTQACRCVCSESEGEWRPRGPEREEGRNARPKRIRDAVAAIISFYCMDNTRAFRKRSFPDGQYSVYYRRPQIDCQQTQLRPSINSFHQENSHASPLVSAHVRLCVVNVYSEAKCVMCFVLFLFSHSLPYMKAMLIPASPFVYAGFVNFYFLFLTLVVSCDYERGIYKIYIFTVYIFVGLQICWSGSNCDCLPGDSHAPVGKGVSHLVAAFPGGRPP